MATNIISKHRLTEIMEYNKDNGDSATEKKFDINHESLRRYKRLYNNEIPKFLNKKTLLNKIAEIYSESELKAIAEGGRIVPGQTKVPIIDFSGDHVKFGYFTDSHIGSIFFEPAFWDAAIKEFQSSGCEFVVHTGDLTEGMSNRPGHVYELTHLGYTEQKKYTMEQLSKWDKQFYIIDGNHDRWNIKNSGAKIVLEISGQLNNVEFLGHDEGDLSLKGKATIKLWHGEDSSSYATSYRVQKIIESFTGGEKPNVLLTGHTHKMVYMFERNIHAVSGGAISKQSSWMRSKRLANHTGFWIIDLWINKKGGISKFMPCWYPFY